MRDFLNAILSFIGATSLTDPEYAAIDQAGLAVATYNAATYTQLSNVLVTRDAVSTTRDRLRFFFLSKDVQVLEPTGQSAIFLGSVL